MSVAALKMSDDYPISDEARERIDSAQARHVEFELRYVLERSGFTRPMIDTIIAAALESLKQSGGRLLAKPFADSLRAKGVPDPDSIANALVPA